MQQVTIGGGVDVAHYLLGVLCVALCFPTAKICDVLRSGLGPTPSICLLASHSFSTIRGVLLPLMFQKLLCLNFAGLLCKDARNTSSRIPARRCQICRLRVPPQNSLFLGEVLLQEILLARVLASAKLLNKINCRFISHPTFFWCLGLLGGVGVTLSTSAFCVCRFAQGGRHSKIPTCAHRHEEHLVCCGQSN